MFSAVVIAVGMAYAAVALVVSIGQSRYLYFPDLPGRALVATPRDIGLDYESVRIATDDGVTLHGWLVPVARARGTILFFHGNAGNISHRLESLRIFTRLGFSVLIFDYRGYGRSDGKPSETGTYRDAVAVWRYLVERRRVRPQDIVLFGRSLGGAIAAWLAVRTGPRALIVESVFTSAPDMAARLFPFLPARLLSRFRYDTEDSLRAVDCPVLVVHSRDDEIIPFEHGRALYRAAHQPKRFLAIHGGHNDGFLVSGRSYVEGLADFLQAVP